MALLASTLTAASVQALPTATYTGLVTGGIDSFGLFGANGADLAGKSFTFVTTYDIYPDDYRGNIHEYDDTYELVQGGIVTANNAPLITADLKIGNVTIPIYTQHSSRVITVEGNYFQNNIYAYNGATLTQLLLFMPTANATNRVNNPFSALVQSGPNAGSSAGFFKFHHYASNVDTNLGLSARTLVVSDGSVVPEPATWAMILIGFGGLGAVLRIRRAKRGPSVSHA